MHEKYTTRGLVVSAGAYREADKIISIYTEDFGLISAVATGVRRSASKLKYHTQDYSLRQFSLVKGRDIWRLVGAEEISGTEPIKSTEHLAAYARVLSLVRRLVRGEEKNERVFLTLLSLHSLLSEPAMLKSGINVEGESEYKDINIDIPSLETLAVFRILHALGYIKSDDTTELLISPLMIDMHLVTAAKPLVPTLISAINSGLTESHL